MDAITNGSLFVVMGNAKLPALTLTINEKLGRHGELSVDAVTDPETKDYLLYEGGGNIGMYAASNGLIYTLFCGIVKRMEARTQGLQCVIHLEVTTASYLMDIHAQNRVFQDTALTSHQLVKKIMEPYQQSEILLTIPDEPLRGIVVQYQETDWSFLNRFLSRYGRSVCVSSAASDICLRTGTADYENRVDWDALPYNSVRNASPKDGRKGLGRQLSYRVEAYDLLALGEMVRFHGQELYIGEITRSLSQGILVSKYVLYFKEGTAVSQYHNPFLGGVSINGTVTGIHRNRIEADLEPDALTEYKSRYSFPFSTVAASPDGSGWYCMPRKGDRVRIFFPTDDETEGYAIANIMGDSAPAQNGPMGNPELKDITTPDGKSVKFIEGGIQLLVGGEKGAIALTNDGRAEIRTDEDIEIHAAEEICLTTKGTMEVTAGTRIQIINDAGSSICMTGDAVEIQASVIESN